MSESDNFFDALIEENLEDVPSDQAHAKPVSNKQRKAKQRARPKPQKKPPVEDSEDVSFDDFIDGQYKELDVTQNLTWEDLTNGAQLYKLIESLTPDRKMIEEILKIKTHLEKTNSSFSALANVIDRFRNTVVTAEDMQSALDYEGPPEHKVRAKVDAIFTKPFMFSADHIHSLLASMATMLVAPQIKVPVDLKVSFRLTESNASVTIDVATILKPGGDIPLTKKQRETVLEALPAARFPREHYPLLAYFHKCAGYFPTPLPRGTPQSAGYKSSYKDSKIQNISTGMNIPTEKDPVFRFYNLLRASITKSSMSPHLYYRVEEVGTQGVFLWPSMVNRLVPNSVFRKSLEEIAKVVSKMTIQAVRNDNRSDAKIFAGKMKAMKNSARERKTEVKNLADFYQLAEKSEARRVFVLFFEAMFFSTSLMQLSWISCIQNFPFEGKPHEKIAAIFDERIRRKGVSSILGALTAYMSKVHHVIKSQDVMTPESLILGSPGKSFYAKTVMRQYIEKQDEQSGKIIIMDYYRSPLEREVYEPEALSNPVFRVVEGDPVDPTTRKSLVGVHSVSDMSSLLSSLVAMVAAFQQREKKLPTLVFASLNLKQNNFRDIINGVSEKYPRIDVALCARFTLIGNSSATFLFRPSSTQDFSYPDLASVSFSHPPEALGGFLAFNATLDKGVYEDLRDNGHTEEYTQKESAALARLVSAYLPVALDFLRISTGRQMPTTSLDKMYSTALNKQIELLTKSNAKNTTYDQVAVDSFFKEMELIEAENIKASFSSQGSSSSSPPPSPLTSTKTPDEVDPPSSKRPRTKRSGKTPLPSDSVSSMEDDDSHSEEL